MKTKEFVALEKRLLPEFPEFAIKGSLMFVTPLGQTLRGFDFESSRSKECFYVYAFFLPLCTPAEYLSYNFGDRLRCNGAELLCTTDPDFEAALKSAMQKEARFLRTLQSPEDVITALRAHVRRTNDPYGYEAIAYLLARQGKARAAVEELDRLVRMLDPVDWQQEMASRAQLLKAKLLANPMEARQQLETWELQSVRNLGLESFRSPAPTPATKS
jgi:hypothetical protein